MENRFAVLAYMVYATLDTFFTKNYGLKRVPEVSDELLEDMTYEDRWIYVQARFPPVPCWADDESDDDDESDVIELSDEALVVLVALGALSVRRESSDEEQDESDDDGSTQSLDTDTCNTPTKSEIDDNPFQYVPIKYDVRMDYVYDLFDNTSELRVYPNPMCPRAYHLLLEFGVPVWHGVLIRHHKNMGPLDKINISGTLVVTGDCMRIYAGCVHGVHDVEVATVCRM